MLRLLTFLAPFLLKGPTKGPVKTLIGRSAIYALILIGLIFMLAALFVWILKIYTLEAAFLTIGAVLLGGALATKIILWSKRPQKTKPVLPQKMEHDLLATHIPESVARDPLVQRILKEIGENPIPATATAVTVGMLLSREYFDGD